MNRPRHMRLCRRWSVLVPQCAVNAVGAGPPTELVLGQGYDTDEPPAPQALVPTLVRAGAVVFAIQYPAGAQGNETIVIELRDVNDVAFTSDRQLVAQFEVFCLR